MDNHLRIRTRVRTAGTVDVPIITTSIPVAIFGDSITAQNSLYNRAGGNYITAITKSPTPQFTRGGHNLVANDEVFHWGVTSMTQVNDVVGVVQSVADASNYTTNNPDTTSATTFSGNSGQGYAIAGAGVQAGLNPAGYMGNLNFITGQRFDFSLRDNRGISSETSNSLVARLSQSLPATRGTKLVILSIGTNDASSLISLATYQSNINTIKSYVHGTLGARLCICTVTPKNADNNTQKDLRDSYNTWIRTLASTTPGQQVYIAECHDAVATATTRASWTSGLDNGDGVHPGQRGAFAMALAIKTALLPVYGYGEWTLKAGNLLVNPTLSGTGGSVAGGGTFVNNGAAANWTFGNVGTVEASRTVSKNGSDQQVLALNVASGKTNSEGATVSQAVAAASLTAGDWYVAEAIVALDSFTGSSNLTRFELSILTGSTLKSRALGTLSGVPTAGFADADMVAQSGQHLLHFKTPATKFLASETSGLTAQIRQLCNCTSSSAASSLRIVAVQMYKVDNPFA